MKSKQSAMAPGSLKHFDERILRHRFGHKMTRDLFAYPNRKPKDLLRKEQVDERLWQKTAWAYRDEDHTEHSDAYLLWQRDGALRNFDLSMAYFNSIGYEEFNKALQRVIKSGRGYQEITSLPEWDGVEGTYIMVFDEYRQFYVGQARDIRKRIKQHWVGRKPFDRILYGTPYDSIFPVDEFRALDTTRIFAINSRNSFAAEQLAEVAADRRFSLNRMTGGATNPLISMLAATNPRHRLNTLTASPLSIQAYDAASAEVSALVSGGEVLGVSALISRLAELDMRIYSVSRVDGSSFMWSRRDSIAGGVKDGSLSVECFAAFLEAVGERVIWPED